MSHHRGLRDFEFQKGYSSITLSRNLDFKVLPKYEDQRKMQEMQ